MVTLEHRRPIARLEKKRATNWYLVERNRHWKGEVIAGLFSREGTQGNLVGRVLDKLMEALS
jgi:hypothetical protein